MGKTSPGRKMANLKQKSASKNFDGGRSTFKSF